MADSENTSASTLSAMSVRELVTIHQACMAIMDTTAAFENRPNCTECAAKFLNDTFDKPAGGLIDNIRGLLKKSETTDRNEIDLIASVLIPYHLENENIERASAELARLVYRQSNMAKAA